MGDEEPRDDRGVRLHLQSLRREHPNAEIVTEHIRIDDEIAIFRATVTIPGGGKATGHGSVRAQADATYIESAEMKALARALAVLGFSAQPAEGEAAPMPGPSRRASAGIRSIGASADADAPTESQGPAQPRPEPPRREPSRPGTPDRPVSPEGAATAGRGTPPLTPFPRPSARPSEADPPLEDFSWTAFWRWAREQGFETKSAIENFVGRSIQSLSPGEVRQLIQAKRSNS